MALWAVGHASTVADDVAFSPSPPPTANKTRHPTTWAFLFFSEFLVIRHIIPSVMFSPAHVAGALCRSAELETSKTREDIPIRGIGRLAGCRSPIRMSHPSSESPSPSAMLPIPATT
jgi:hypothetical protein